MTNGMYSVNPQAQYYQQPQVAMPQQPQMQSQMQMPPQSQVQQQPGNYSGVTININNPSVNPNQNNPCSCPCCNPQYQSYPAQNQMYNPIPPVAMPQSYPAPYYINNYNPNIGDKGVIQELPAATNDVVQPQEEVVEKKSEEIPETKNANDVSDKIINDLDTRSEEEKNKAKMEEDKNIVKLTNEYIKSLENYLDNPNKDIRVMASKELLKRFAEDTDRYDDEALNALLNKMLQDPEKIVRVAALSALSSGLASGNEYTVKLLNDIQADPNADKEDVLETANILLKMSSKDKAQSENADAPVDIKQGENNGAA